MQLRFVERFFVKRGSGSARTIIVQFEGQYPGTSPTMHGESANMEDI